MKIKEESRALEGLVENMMNSGSYNQISLSNDPPEFEEPKPIVEIDFKRKTKEFKRKARNSILQIIKNIMPDDMIQNQYVQDKLNQDAEQLGKLYFQEYLIETTQQIQVDSITRGNLSPRMFEVFATISKNHSDIAKQISDFQTILRKSYIDMKIDIRNAKQTDQEAIEEFSNKILPNNVNPEQIFVGSKDLISIIKKKKELSMRQAQNLADAEDAIIIQDSSTNNAPSDPNL